MKKAVITSLSVVVSLCFVLFFLEGGFAQRKMIKESEAEKSNLKLGAFSISLNVKDLEVSKEFYEKFGFVVFAGSLQQHYLIMKNGNALVGLFHGMFEKNILTFNPGWDENAQKLKSFNDVREIQTKLKSQGVKIESEIPDSVKGPAGIFITDPDGNPILIDQHVE